MFTRKQIWRLLIPLMLEQLLTALMGTADTMMVARVGSAAISAVSLTDAINVLMINIFSAMATGGTIICAQYLGRGENGDARATGGQLVLAVGAISAIITIVFVALRVPMLRLIFGSVAADVMENAQVYFLITALSYPFIALYNAGAALFRVEGNSRLPLVVSTGANLFNIAGNALLIFGCKMGVAGAALATLLSRALSCVLILLELRRPGRVIVVRDYLRLKPDMARIRRILAVGIPTGIENGMFQFGKLAIQSTVSTLSTVAIAANAMVSTQELLISNAPIGMGLGLMTIVGQCIGAGRKEEARRWIVHVTLYGEVLMVFSCALMLLTAGPIAGIAGLEAEAVEMTREMWRFIAVTKTISWTLAFIPAYGFRAAGDVRFSMILSMTSMWTCRVVTAIVLMRVFGFGPIAVWIGMAADWTLRAICFTLRFRSGRWLGHDVLGKRLRIDRAF